jgi:hypothetical protein
MLPMSRSAPRAHVTSTEADWIAPTAKQNNVDLDIQPIDSAAE